MINRHGRQVIFSDDAKKASASKLKVEILKHTGKEVNKLSVKERDDLLLALCESMSLVNKDGKLV